MPSEPAPLEPGPTNGGGSGGFGAADALLQERMCYFVLGNLHRVVVELTDRGAIFGGGHGGHSSRAERHLLGQPLNAAATVTVATLVQALQVAAACAYPPNALARLLTTVVSGADHCRSVWEVHVDITLLEAQLDSFLMAL
jgi:hypothetical protein